MKKKKAASLLCAAVLAVSLLTGCGGKAEPTPASSSGEESQVSLGNTGENAKLILAEISAGLERTAVLREIADKYQEDFPNTEIEIVSLQSQEELNMRLQAGEQTDLCEVSGEAAAALVREGRLQNIAPYLKVWDEYSTLSSAAKQAADAFGSEQAYLIPYSIEQEALYYRKDLFAGATVIRNEREIALPVPTTWEEVDLAAQTLASKTGGLAVAGGEKLIDYMDSVLWSTMGFTPIASPKSAAYFSVIEGGTIFSLEETEEAMETFVSLFTRDVPEEALGWTEEEALQAFQEGKTAMLLGGREIYARLQREMPEGSWDVTGYPAGKVGVAVFSDRFAGWAIPANAETSEIAVHFLCFLSNADNNTHFARETDSVPVHTSAPILDDFFREEQRSVFTDMMTQGDKYQLASEPMRYQAWEGYREQANEELREMLAGESTQEETLSWLDQYWTQAYRQEGKLWEQE